MVAPVAAGNGAGRLYVNPVQGRFDVSPVGGGAGRARIDALNRTGFRGVVIPEVSGSFGKLMLVLPPDLSRLSIVSAAGQTIPEGTNALAPVFLPFGSDTNQIVRVQARNFAGIVTAFPVRKPWHTTWA